MRLSLLVVTLVALGGCATTAPPATAPSTSAAAPTSSARPSSVAPASSSAKASTALSSLYDTLPAGYSFGYLSKLTQVGGRWSVVIDPVTMCSYPSKDPDCADLTEAPPNDYEIRNLSPKAYTVPLVTGVVFRIVGPTGQQDDNVVQPMVEKSWPTSNDQARMIVTYETNPAGEVSGIKEWWHP
ncbi:MAG: hypothetical protein ACOH16_08430 [Propionibacteriaceae bacterium]